MPIKTESVASGAESTASSSAAAAAAAAAVMADVAAALSRNSSVAAIATSTASSNGKTSKAQGLSEKFTRIEGGEQQVVVSYTYIPHQSYNSLGRRSSVN